MVTRNVIALQVKSVRNEMKCCACLMRNSLMRSMAKLYLCRPGWKDGDDGKKIPADGVAEYLKDIVMNCNYCKSELNEEVDAATLIAALFFLMTRYSRSQDTNLVQPILDHFDWLAAHPELVNSQLQKTCLRLRKSWELMPEISFNSPTSFH